MDSKEVYKVKITPVYIILEGSGINLTISRALAQLRYNPNSIALCAFASYIRFIHRTINDGSLVLLRATHNFAGWNFGMCFFVSSGQLG